MTLNFSFLCILAAGLLLFLAGVFAIGARRHPELWRTLPRERVAGTVLGLAALAFSAWQSELLLEGGLLRLRPVIWALVPVLTVLGCLYLDFLLTRALGGLLMLLAPQLLQGAFTAHLPMRPAFSAACYLAAILGALLMAMPWQFRDLLELSATRPAWRWPAAGLCAALALPQLLALLFALTSGN